MMRNLLTILSGHDIISCMPKEKSIGGVVFTIIEGTPHYLLLHYPSAAKTNQEYWDLPKGHAEEGEEELDTARREIEEETGLRDIEFIDGFQESIHYFFQFEGKTISKTVTFYLAGVKTQDITISDEHIGYQWLPYLEATKQATYQNAKAILTKAQEYLSKKGI